MSRVNIFLDTNCDTLTIDFCNSILYNIGVIYDRKREKMSTRSNIAIEDPKTKKVKVIMSKVMVILMALVDAWLIITTIMT